MGAQTGLVIITALLGALAIGGLYFKAKNERPDKAISEKLTMSGLLEIVKRKIADYVKDELYNVADEEFVSAYERRKRLMTALTQCVYGIDSAKVLVQDMMRNEIKQVLPTEESILDVLNFKAGYLDPEVKFEIIMYFYKKEFGKDALTEMIDKYKLAEPRYVIEDGTKPSYMITSDDINYVYLCEKYELTYDVMLDILTVLIYQKYKGFGVIDTVREMNIDGMTCGTSGSLLYNLVGTNDKKIMKGPRSVWIQFRGCYIHLRFLTFGTEEELRRVTQLICRWTRPGPLTEKRGFIISTMYDKSRVLTMRPPAGECWAFFLRKFTLREHDLEFLWNPQVEVETDEDATEEEVVFDGSDETAEISEYPIADQPV